MPKLYKFQRIGVRRGHKKFKNRFLLADDMGLGKTVQGLWSAKCFWKKWPIVVVCPAFLKWNWEVEVDRHLGMTRYTLEGRKTHPIPKCRVIIVNYEILGDWLDEIAKVNPRGVLVDEYQYIKNRETKRSKHTVTLCRNYGRRRLILMSGTPIEKKPAEIWVALNLLRPDLYPTFRPFGVRYCKPERTPWGMKYNGADRTDELNRILKKTCMIRRRKVDVLKDLPPKRRMVIPVKLSAPDLKLYKAEEQKLVRWLIATRGIPGLDRQNKRRTMMIRLKVLIGMLKAPVTKEWIQDFLDSTDRKLITCCVHRKLIADLHQTFRDVTVQVHGGIKKKERRKAVETFMKRKKYRHFIGQIRAAGVGLNLQAASSVLFAELNWNPAEHTQFEDRAHRIGQTNPVDVYYLIAEGTIEERLCAIIQDKQKIVDAVLDGKESDESLLIMDQLEKELIGKRRIK